MTQTNGGSTIHESIPDKLGAIVAYRAWTIQLMVLVNGDYRVRLKSLFALDNQMLWPPHETMEARCLILLSPHPSDVPLESCSCGIYALKTACFTEPLPASFVTGEVYLWGKVIECERGFRAQYAYPKRLWVSGTEAMARALALDYGVEIELIPEQQQQPYMPQPQWLSLPRPFYPPQGIADGLQPLIPTIPPPSNILTSTFNTTNSWP